MLVGAGVKKLKGNVRNVNQYSRLGIDFQIKLKKYNLSSNDCSSKEFKVGNATK